MNTALIEDKQFDSWVKSSTLLNVGVVRKSSSAPPSSYHPEHQIISTGRLFTSMVAGSQFYKSLTLYRLAFKIDGMCLPDACRYNTGIIMKASRQRLFILTLLFIVTAINYMDRANLAVAGSNIQNDFSLTPTQLGLLFSMFTGLRCQSNSCRLCS